MTKYYHCWVKDTELYAGVVEKSIGTESPSDQYYVCQEFTPVKMPKPELKDGWYVVCKGGATAKFFLKVGFDAYTIDQFGKLSFISHWSAYDDHVIGSVEKLCNLIYKEEDKDD